MLDPEIIANTQLVEDLFADLPGLVEGAISDSPQAVSDLVLADLGGGHPLYPETTASNEPPVDFYIRYQGTQTATGNLNNSQKMGDQFTVEYVAPAEIHINNPTGYAPDVIGEQQEELFRLLGWTKLIDRTKEKLDGIADILAENIGYRLQGWLSRHGS